MKTFVPLETLTASDINNAFAEKAALAGSASQTFSVAPATAAAHAVRSDQVSVDNANFPVYTAPTAWVPVLTGITQVGAVSNEFTYIKVGRLYFVNVYLSATTSTTTTGGTSSITLPSTPSISSSCSAANVNTGIGLTNGLIYQGNGGLMFPPSVNVGANIPVVFTAVYYS